MKKSFTKWFSFAVLSVLAGLGVAFAEEVVADPTIEVSMKETTYVKNVDGTYYIKEGEAAAITVKLNQNGTKVYGLQADILAPDGFEVEVVGVDAEGITTTSKQRTDGYTRVAVYSATPIDAKISDILTIKVTPAEEDADDGYVSIENVTISKDENGAPVDFVPAVNEFDFYVMPGIAEVYNADFEIGTPVAKKVCTSAKNAKEGEVANAQVVKGWTIVTNGDNRAAGLFAYGSTAILGGQYEYKNGDNTEKADAKAPAAGYGNIAGYPEGNSRDDDQALGIVACWSSSTQYTQTVVLPAGTHALLVPVYNVGGEAAIAKNQIGVIVGETETFAKTTNYKRGEWTLETIEFTLEEESEVTYSVGYTAPHVGFGTMPHLFIGEVVELVGNEVGEEYYTYRLNLKKIEATNYLNSLPAPDAGQLFCYPKDDVKAGKAAVKDAETFEEVEAALAAVNASQILPYDENTPYVFKHVSSGRYLTLVDGALVLAGTDKAKATSLYFEPAEGGYYVTDKDAKQQSYIGLQTNSTYKMQTEPALKTVVTPVYVKMDDTETSLYMALKEKNGHIGTDSDDEGSICYADKNASDKDAAKAARAQWVIERAEPVYAIVDEEAEPEKYRKGWYDNKVLPVDWTINNGITVDNFHCNCWSGEGANDGSGMTVSFVEYWVYGAGGAVLAPATMSYKTLDVTPGDYTVELLLRAYNEKSGSETPTGVTVAANEVSDDLSNATEFKYNNMSGVWKNFELKVTVGADGKLAITVNVVKDAKVSWVAFKNLKVTMAAPPVLKLVDENLINDPTDELQKEALAYYNYYTTPETYNEAAAAIANAQKVADFYKAHEEDIDALDRDALKIFREAEKVETTAEGLKAALDKAMKTMIEAGDDVTQLIANNSFETGDLTGWTVVNGAGDTGVKPISNATYVVNNADGAYVFNTWNNGVGYEIKQTITDMPAGTYKLQALFASDANATAELYANDESVQITTPGPKETGVECELTFTLDEDGDITIGIKNPSIWYKADNFRLIYVSDETPEPVDPDLVEIPQDQGKDLDTFTRTDLEEGEDYNTYTAHGDLNIAFKMVDIDVEGCDYIIVKFAEPVDAGWNIALWSGQELDAIPEGATEYKYVFADDPNCAIVDDVLPQICVMTFFGAPNPLTMKVTGVYKHKVGGEPGPATAINSIDKAAAPKAGKYIENGAIVIYKNGKKFNVAGVELK